jgi:F-type H+-transporting ATPase subunit b
LVDIDATLFAQIINFLILVAILTKVAYKPLVKVLTDRTTRIENAIAAADKEKLLAEQFKQELERNLSEARIQAQVIIDKAEKFAVAKGEAQIEQTRQECARLLAASQDEIVRERDIAIAEMRAEVVSLSLAAASKIIGDNMTSTANSRLVESFIAKLDEEKPGSLPC